MRILTVHADFIEFQALNKAIKDAPEVSKEKKRVEECLVVFSAVEKNDTQEIAQKAVNEIIAVLNQVKANRIVLYPLVHLTSTPSSPALALSVLQEMEKTLASNYEVTRAPFGWYKSYDLKCKGHPLSELSRQINLEKKAEKEGEPLSDSLKQEEKTKSEFFILDVDGNLTPVNQFDYSRHANLKKFVDYEIHKVRAYEIEPAHIKIMREHRLVDYEPGSDSGNLRWYPKGRLIKKLIERKVSDICITYGAMEVETPIMYDFEHPSLKKYLNRFPARQYVVKSEDKDLFLRFAACFGQFLIAHDAVISHKSLPVRIFELAKYSFRREQSGEVAGLKRLRCFTMPDMHTLCKDYTQAKHEFENQFDICLSWTRDFGFDIETAFRIQKDWYNENKEWYSQLVGKLGKPILVEMFDLRYAYFITKFEFNIIDSQNKGSALSTVQIDIENAETYDINFIAESNEKKKPVILHASISGSTDRVVYALLESEAKKIEEKKTPMFPVWLSPTQVRLIPVSNAQVQHCESLLSKLKAMNIRVDLDDREETLQKKIREAEKDWVPYSAVIGEKEIAENTLSVRVRSTGKNEKITLENLVNMIKKECENKPFEMLSLNDHLSRRPIV